MLCEGSNQGPNTCPSNREQLRFRCTPVQWGRRTVPALTGVNPLATRGASTSCADPGDSGPGRWSSSAAALSGGWSSELALDPLRPTLTLRALRCSISRPGRTRQELLVGLLSRRLELLSTDNPARRTDSTSRHAPDDTPLRPSSPGHAVAIRGEQRAAVIVAVIHRARQPSQRERLTPALVVHHPSAHIAPTLPRAP